MAPEETAEGAPRQFVVRRVSSRGGAQVWVEWLGYPDDRSCWRSLTEHLKKPASCSGSGGGAAGGGGGGGPNYCVSQRIKMFDEKLVKVVGRAHGAVIPPPRNFDSSWLLAKAAKAAEKSNEIGDNEEETSEEEEDPELLFPVPLLEHEDLDDEREDLKQVSTTRDPQTLTLQPQL